jgi:dTMP kinase
MSSFIVLEGIDGSGKTTQTKLIEKKLKSSAKEAIIVREPGGTSLGELVRTILKTEKDLDPLTQLLLFSSCRRELIHKVIKPALSQNKNIICDRYIYSTLVYQGFEQGLQLTDIHNVISISTDNIVPDLIIFIDTPAEIAKSRRINGTDDTFDNRDLQFYQGLRKGYLEIADKTENWFSIDGTKTISEIEKDIWNKVEPLL